MVSAKASQGPAIGGDLVPVGGRGGDDPTSPLGVDNTTKEWAVGIEGIDCVGIQRIHISGRGPASDRDSDVTGLVVGAVDSVVL